jgi:hypothetical protein
MTTVAAISSEPYPQTAIATAAATVTMSKTDRSRLQTFGHTGHASARVSAPMLRCCSHWARAGA